MALEFADPQDARIFQSIQLWLNLGYDLQYALIQAEEQYPDVAPSQLQAIGDAAQAAIEGAITIGGLPPGEAIPLSAIPQIPGLEPGEPQIDVIVRVPAGVPGGGRSVRVTVDVTPGMTVADLYDVASLAALEYQGAGTPYHGDETKFVILDVGQPT